MIKEQLEFVIKGGLTKRYHTVDTIKEQNVAEHSFFVGWLLAFMYSGVPTLGNLIMYALQHDIAEGHIGDISSPVKRAMPDLKVLLDKAEEIALQNADIGQMYLSPLDKRRFKLADNMEGMLFCCIERYKGNKAIIEVYKNFNRYAFDLHPQGRELELFNTIQEYWNVATAHGQ